MKNIINSKKYIVIAGTLAILICISTILSYFSYIKRIQAFFTIKPTYKLTYEYYEIDTDGSKTKLDKTETITLFANDVITLGEDEEYILTSDRYSSMDFEIEGDEEDGVQVKRKIGYSFEMPSKSIVVKQNYYLKPLVGNVIIHHYENGTTNKLAEDEQLSGALGVSFSVSNLMSDENKLILDGVEQTQEREYFDNEIYTYNSVEADEEKVTINTNDVITGEITAEDIVITYYYTAVKCNITGEVVGGNGQISDVTETVIKGTTSTKDIIFTPNSGYRVEKIMVYSGAEITAYNNGTTEGIGTQITEFDEDQHTLVSTMEPLQNVTEDKHIVVTFEERPYVAQIVAVPTDETNLTSTIFADEAILNHKYYTLQDALNDAYYVNQTSEETNKLVEIKIIANIRNESVNIIDSSLDDDQTENSISIDLNGYLINSSAKLKPTIKVTDNSVLIVKDTSVLETGKIISKNGIGIFVESDAELTLGVDVNPVSLVSPYIEGKTYGVYKEQVGEGTNKEEGIFNFYDGKIFGETAVYGTVNDKPAAKKVYVEYDSEKEKNVAYLTNLEDVEAVIGKKTYTHVEDAIDEANNIFGLNGEPVEVDLVSAAAVENTMQILANRNITFDYNGNTISSQASAPIFTNNGNFIIKDSTEEEYDYVLNNTSAGLFTKDDNGALVLTNVKGTTESAYIPIDLRSYTAQDSIPIVVNAEQTVKYGYSNGFVKLRGIKIPGTASGTDGRFAYLDGNVNATNYSINAQGGKIYYLHLGFTSLYSYSDDANEFKVNSIKVNGQEINVGVHKGLLTKTTGNVVLNNSGATLTINGGIIYSANANNGSSTNATNAAVKNNGTLNINGGYVKALGSHACGVLNNSSSLVMNGGEIYSAGNAIFNKSSATINNGTILNDLYNAVGGTTTFENGFLNSRLYNANTNTQNASVIVRNGTINTIYNYGTGVKTDIYNTNVTQYTFVNNNGTNSITNIYGGYFYRLQNSAGTLNMTAGNVTYSGSDSYYAVYTTGSSSVTNISGGKIKDLLTNGYNSGAVYNYNGTTNISGNTIVESTYRNSIYNAHGIVNIKGGTIVQKGTNKYAIVNDYSGTIGTVTIGSKNSNDENAQFSQVNPSIRSAKYGINDLAGAVKFYDGEIIAQSGMETDGAFSEIEEYNLSGQKLEINVSTISNLGSYYDDYEGLNRMYLDVATTGVARILKTSIDSQDIAQLTVNDDYYEYTDNGNSYYVFYNLDNAIQVCSETAGSTKTTIELINNISTTHNLNIAAGKNIILNLNGKTIKHYGNNVLLTNNGTLDVINSDSTGSIISRNRVLVNNGTASLNANITSLRETYGSTVSRRIISNTGTLTLEGGTITTYYAIMFYNTGNLIVNNGTTIANFGTITRRDSVIIRNAESGRCVINGGTHTINDTSEAYAIQNQNTATLKITGGTFNYHEGVLIYNTSTSSYVENSSEPAVYIQGGTFYSYRSDKMVVYDNSSNESEIWIKKDANLNLSIYSQIQINKAKLVMENVTTNYTIFANGPENTIINCAIGSIWFRNNSSTDLISGGSTGGISKQNGGKLLISGVTVNGTVSNSGTGAVTIKNSSITSPSLDSAVENSGTGSITIIDKQKTGEPNKRTEITCNSYHTYDYGIYNSSTGTITIGEKDGVVDTVYPKIISSNSYGVNNSSTGTFNFYDGSIKGSTKNSFKAINGTVSNVEDGYEVIISETDTTNNTETRILGKLVVAKVLKSAIQTANLTDINYVDLDTDYYGFYSIQDAASACTNNSQTTVIIVRNTTITTNGSSETISANKNIILDLNGYEINTAKVNYITNNGTMKIIDSSTNKTGVINTTVKGVFTNSGTLTIENIAINTSFTGSSIENDYFALNSGTLTLTNNTLNMATSNNISFIKNTGTLSMSRGTYTRNNLANDSYLIYNTGDATISNLSVNELGLYNSGTGTIESVDVNITYGGIVNYSTKMYVENTSKPAIRLKGGTYVTVYRNTGAATYYNITNYAGEIIFENNQETNNNLNINGYMSSAMSSLLVEGGKITINSGTIEENIKINSGSIEMNDGLINGKSSTNTASIEIASGTTMNVNGGQIGNYSEITNNGILNIGVENENISAESPTVIVSSPIINNSELNFYNGKIQCTKIPVNGDISSIPTNCEVIYTINNGTHTYTLSKTDVVATIGEGANLQNYTTLEAAFADCVAGSNTQINMQKSVAIINENEFTISNTHDITLNLNGNTIVGNCSGVLFTNNGTFEVTDITGGTILTCGSNLINNTGALTISKGTLTNNLSNKGGTIISNSGTGTVTITGGTINAVANYSKEYNGYGIYSTSTGNITITGGVFDCKHSVNRYSYAITVVNNANNPKANVSIGGNVVINNDEKTYGFWVQNVNLSITGGTNNNTNEGNVINNSIATITGGTIKGKTTINSSSTVTISGNSTSVGAIENNGKTTVNGGLITGRFTNKNSATFNGGKISTTDTEALLVSGAQTNTLNSGFKVEGKNTNSSSYGIYIEDSGKCTVNEGVTVTSNNGTGIYIKAGTLTLGIKERPVSTTSPIITGAVYGVNNYSTGIFNFYDGIITGTGSGALGGTVPSDLPDNYAVQISNGGTTAWLENSATATDVASVNGVTYKSLQSAINATTSGTITIVGNILLESPILIQEGKTIEIDLRSCKIEYEGEEATIKNQGTLTILDTAEDGTDLSVYAIIKNTTGPAIQNEGTLTIGRDSDMNVYSNSPRIIGGTYAVVNTQHEVPDTEGEGTHMESYTFRFLDGVLKGVTAAVSGQITETTTITGYTLTDESENDNGTTYHIKYYKVQN